MKSSTKIKPRNLFTPFYYSASDVFDWLLKEDAELAIKWTGKMATDRNASPKEKCKSLIDIIEHTSECLAEIAPSRSKNKKIAKEISSLVNDIIE